MQRLSRRPVGELCFSVLVAVAIAASLLLARGAERAEAFTLGGESDTTNHSGQTLTLNNENVNITFVSREAQSNNRFGRAVPSGSGYSAGPLYFTCSSATPGTVVDAGDFNGTSELVMYLRTAGPSSPTYFTGPGTRNPDNKAHARMTQQDATTVRLEWEDQSGLGDADFDDCIVDIIITPISTPTATATTPATVTATNTSTRTPTSTATATATATFGPPQVSALSLSVDPTQAAAGATIPISDLEDALIEGAGPQPSAVRSIAVRSISPETVAVRSIDVRSSAVRSIAVRSILLEGLPLDDVLLAQIPIYRDGGWGAILKGTSLDGVPPQNIPVSTVLDFAGVDPTLPPPALQASPPAGVQPLSLGEIDLRSTAVRSISLASLALGSTAVRSIPVPPNSGDSQADWCSFLSFMGFDCVALGLDVNTTTPMSLEFSGVPVASSIADIAVRSIDLQASAVRSIAVRSINVKVSAVRSILVKDLPAGVIDCNLIDCSPTSTQDLGNAQDANAISANATIGDLLAFFPQDVTLRDLLMTLIPLDNVAWEDVPLDSLLPFAGREVTYTLSFTNSGVGPLVSPEVKVDLPSGFGYVPGSSEHVPASGPNEAVADPQIATSMLTWALAATVQPGETFTLRFKARPSFEVGTFTSSADVNGPGTSASVDGVAGVHLIESFEPNDELSPPPPVLPEDVLEISHISFADDRDLSRIAVPPAGERISYFLSHIPQDADLDAVLHEPGSTAVRSIAVRSIPLQSNPLPDNGFDADPSNDGLEPETRQDLNTVQSLAVRSISANEGDGTETIEASSLEGDGGYFTQAVTGYNGAHSTSPYVQRYNVTSPRPVPQCTARQLAFSGVRATSAPVIPQGVNTLILTSQERLGSLYGAAVATNVMTSLNNLASQNALGVTGAVVPVDFYGDVAAAYATWDANPCAPDSANDIVNAILGHVNALTTANPGIKYVVLAGSDEVIPHARVFDGVTISNESSYAGEVAALGTSAISSSLLSGNVLTDDRYGDRDPVQWLGRELYVPDMSVGRLVETPQDIMDSVSRYVQFQGVLDASTANSGLTTGYDFLADGAEKVGDELDARPGASPTTRLIDETWDRTALLNAMFSGTTPGVISPNAHYDHFELLPAAGNTSPSTADLVTTADIGTPPLAAGKLNKRLIFTMGCHSGLNVPDVIVSAPTPSQAASLNDWAQAYSKAGVSAYVGNSGYGYGDTLSVAYSERLMQLFAARLDGSLSIGQAMTYAKQEYFGALGVYGEYDLKVLSESIFYGLPMYAVNTGVAGPPMSLAFVQSSSPGLVPDASTGLDSKPVDFTPTFTEVPADGGTSYFIADGLPPQITHYRPPLPRMEEVVTSPDPSLKAHGVLVTDLQSQYTEDYLPP
ncbi:MAG TPA: hypothetical protein VIH21_00675, partial [Dehalococcoidia bacterium]